MTRIKTKSLPTAEQIRTRLGVSSGGFPRDRKFGAREIAMVRAAGLTRLELDGYLPPAHVDHRDSAHVTEIAGECRTQGVSIVSVHGPNLPYPCPYEEVRQAVVRETLAAVRTAEELGASVFIGHFGTDDVSAKTVEDILRESEGGTLRLAVENLPGKPLCDYASFVERIGAERFGMILDIGHPRTAEGRNPFTLAGQARETVSACGDRLFHVHLHDFKETDHYPPFEGDIQWDEVVAGLEDVGYREEYMFEVLDRQSSSPEHTLKSIAAFPDAFAARYTEGATDARLGDGARTP